MDGRKDWTNGLKHGSQGVDMGNRATKSELTLIASFIHSIVSRPRTDTGTNDRWRNEYCIIYIERKGEDGALIDMTVKWRSGLPLPPGMRRRVYRRLARTLFFCWCDVMGRSIGIELGLDTLYVDWLIDWCDESWMRLIQNCRSGFGVWLWIRIWIWIWWTEHGQAWLIDWWIDWHIQIFCRGFVLDHDEYEIVLLQLLFCLAFVRLSRLASLNTPWTSRFRQSSLSC